MSLPWAVSNDFGRRINIYSIFFSVHANMRVQADKFNILKIFNLWTKKSLSEIPSKHRHWDTLLMWSGITFNFFKKVTILKIYPREEIYFFPPIFAKWRICPLPEYSVPKKRGIDISSSEVEIWLAQTKVEKKVIWFVSPKCILKIFKKKQCCIFDGWWWKKVAVKIWNQPNKNWWN